MAVCPIWVGDKPASKPAAPKVLKSLKTGVPAWAAAKLSLKLANHIRLLVSPGARLKVQISAKTSTKLLKSSLGTAGVEEATPPPT